LLFAAQVLCLSASLLEKEQLLFGAGIQSGESYREETSDAAKLSREALSRASHNLMLQELEGLQKVFCQVQAPIPSHCVYAHLSSSRLLCGLCCNTPTTVVPYHP
jgi:hypothetical protein